MSLSADTVPLEIGPAVTTSHRTRGSSHGLNVHVVGVVVILAGVVGLLLPTARARPAEPASAEPQNPPRQP